MSAKKRLMDGMSRYSDEWEEKYVLIVQNTKHKCVLFTDQPSLYLKKITLNGITEQNIILFEIQ